MITKSELEMYLEKIDIKEYLEAEYDLDFSYSNKGWYQTNCPMPNHIDSEPSFGVNPETGRFNCFSCGANGNFVNLLMKLEGLSYEESIKRLIEIVGAEGGDDMSKINRSVRAATVIIDNYLDLSNSKLPGGMSEVQFMMSVTKRLNEYRSQHPELPFDRVENQYKIMDNLLNNEDYNGIRAFWKNLIKDLKT